MFWMLCHILHCEQLWVDSAMKRKTNTGPALQEEFSGTTLSVRTTIMFRVKKNFNFILESDILFLNLESWGRCQILKRYWVDGGIECRSICQENPHSPYIQAMSTILERNSLNLKNFGIMFSQFVRGTTEVQKRS